MTGADIVIQSVFEALKKDDGCEKTVDALSALHEAGRWEGQKIVVAIRGALDEAEGD